MKTTHTPGPWTASDQRVYANVNGTTVAIAAAARTVSGFKIGSETATANARIMALSPALLANLKVATQDLKKYLEDIGGCDHSVGICCCDISRNLESALAVIAEAEPK